MTNIVAAEQAGWRETTTAAADELLDLLDTDQIDHRQAVVMAMLRIEGWQGRPAEHVASILLGQFDTQDRVQANRHIDSIEDPAATILDAANDRREAAAALRNLRSVLADHRDAALGIPSGAGTRFDFDQPAPPTPWLVPGLLVRGSVHLMSGREHAFKTGLWDAAMMASLTGRDLLGMNVEPLRWLRVDMENPPRKIHERWGAMGFENEHWNAVRLFTRKERVRLTEPVWQDWLRRQVEDHEPDVIVLDTVSRIWFGMDANANDQIVRIFDFLQPLCDEHGVAFVLPHHQRKSGGRGDDAALGGVQWQGQADQTMTIAKTSQLVYERQPDGTVNTLSKFALTRPKGRDIVDPAPLHFDVAGIVRDDRLVSMAAQLPAVEPTTAERIVAALAQPLGTGALAQAVELNRTGDKFRKALAEAVESGQVVKNDDGLYERGEDE